MKDSPNAPPTGGVDRALALNQLMRPGGERFQAMKPPAVIDGTLSINIRKHSNLVKTLDELDMEGCLRQREGTARPIDSD